MNATEISTQDASDAGTAEALCVRAKTRKIKTLPVNQISADPEQPRKSFDAALLAELADSITRQGLIQPIVVRPMKRGGGGSKSEYIIVTGERRWRACQIAGIETIDCVVRTDLEGDIETRVIQIMENVSRADMTPMEEALSFQRLIDDGMTVMQVVKALGFKSRTRVQDRINMLGLAEEHRALVDQKILLPTMASDIGMLPRADQARFVERVVNGSLTSVEAVREAIAAYKNAARGVAAKSAARTAEPVIRDEAREIDVAAKIEQKINAIQSMASCGLSDEGCAALARTSPERASEMVEKLAVARKAVLEMERQLRQALADAEAIAQASSELEGSTAH